MNRITSHVLVLLAVAAGLTAATLNARANNLVVTNVTVSPRDNSTAFIKFDISWENSWYFTNVNHDAAWVFFKVQKEGNTTWTNHAILEANQVENPTGFSVGSGTALDFIVPPDKVGMFVRRSAEGAGPLASSNVRAVWNFTSNSLLRTEKVKIQAFAVEMVYVAEGSFKVGAGGSRISEFYTYPDVNIPYLITSEAAITVGTAAGNLYYSSTTYGGDRGTPIPLAYPKGYKAFYCMKYEITQGQYRDFLNALTRTQQGTRIASQTADQFAMSDKAAIECRNGIRCPSSIPIAPEPIIFGCDANENKIFNETNDAMDRACNYLSRSRGYAFADWAGLRPMTELEFEKACRGPLNPVANEYAWGSTAMTAQTGHAGTDGDGTETALPVSANCHFGIAVNGPVRVGIYATTSSTREQAGASYWGIMELSGNVAEVPITVGTAAGRNFTGLHGDGKLTSSGNADVTGWSDTSDGCGYRGGACMNFGNMSACVSDRNYGFGQQPSWMIPFTGWRGVRTAPSGVGP